MGSAERAGSATREKMKEGDEKGWVTGGRHIVNPIHNPTSVVSFPLLPLPYDPVDPYPFLSYLFHISTPQLFHATIFTIFPLYGHQFMFLVFIFSQFIL